MSLLGYIAIAGAVIITALGIWVMALAIDWVVDINRWEGR